MYTLYIDQRFKDSYKTKDKAINIARVISKQLYRWQIVRVEHDQSVLFITNGEVRQ